MNDLARQIYRALLPYETRLWLYKQRHRKDYDLLRKIVHPSEKGDFSLKPYDQHECIFVHITKTAGTSVAKSLFGYLPYHYTAVDYRVIYGRKTFDRYFKFAFVRNPWDRLYSAWRYLKAGGWDDKDCGWSSAHLSEFDDFNSFVRQWVNTDNINKHMHFWPQYKFICDNKRSILIDYLAYFETLQSDYDHIRNQLGIHNDIGRHNANPGHDYRNVYDKESLRRVSSVYATDIDMFGYDFDGINKRTYLAQLSTR